MLVLGTQILLGFQFRSVFEPAFESLPRSSQTLKMFGLVILLVAIAFMMSPGSFHRIVRSGSDAERSEEHTSELQSQSNLVCRLLLEKKKKKTYKNRLIE